MSAVPASTGSVGVTGGDEAGAPGVASLAGLTPSDLAELMASFNEVTGKLEATHEQLRGEVTRLRGDLTDAREQLARSRRLAALGEMAAGIAHEIRNPLASIGLYTRLLEEDLPGGDQREMAGKVRQAVRRLDEIVGDVLAFARETRVRPRWVDVEALLQDAADWRRAEAERRDPPVELVVVAPSDARAEAVWCDPALTQQALVNLIANAVEASGEAARETGRGGLVEIGAERASPLDEAGRRLETVCLRVRDDGPGISPEVVERMFNPFFTTRATGTGLGLAIVHRIVDAHGGRVVVRRDAGARPGRGATVELHYPASPADAREGGGSVSLVNAHDKEVAA